MILDKYAWTNRLVIVVTEKNKNKQEKETRQFFDLHQREEEDRKIFEEEERKRSKKVRGERTPMPPRGDKRREDFEKWYAANVR